jgi:cell division protein DivIC
MDKVMFKEQKRRSREEESPKKNILFQLFLIGISLFLLFNIGKSIQIALQKLEILQTARDEVDELRIQNITHLLKKDTLESDDYVETAARDRLNYSKDGEIVFVIPEGVLLEAQKSVGYILNDQLDITKEKGTIQQWREFFIDGV